MSTYLPRDDNFHPIPALRLRPGGAHALPATGAGSVRNSVGFDDSTRVIGLYATGPVFVRTGDQYATASPADHYFPAGTYVFFSLGDNRQGQGRHSHIAVLGAGTDCTLYVSELE